MWQANTKHLTASVILDKENTLDRDVKANTFQLDCHKKAPGKLRDVVYGSCSGEYFKEPELDLVNICLNVGRSLTSYRTFSSMNCMKYVGSPFQY